LRALVNESGIYQEFTELGLTSDAIDYSAHNFSETQKDSIEYNDYLNRIGNLTILQDKKNIKARNKDFSGKKPFYSNSRLRITLSLIDYETWNYSTISKRQEDLFEIVREIWK
ncbi:MAG: HNH endonuclease, partial [Saprospiraceae bacterium]|nr:HNH endonuclease [Saprospiraceae bacterium]